MHNSKSEVLLIFIKNLQVGQVKTRLAATVGDQKAYNVYQQLLALTKSTADQLSCYRQLWYSQFVDENDDWESTAYNKKLQQGNDLGERMKFAFANAFEAGFERAVIIGSDCAELQPKHISKAFRSLYNYDLVIGPSQDGGYYLLGMNTLHPQLFDDMEWSTSSVYQDTIRRIESLSLSYKNLPTLNDIDTEEDLRESGQRLQSL